MAKNLDSTPYVFISYSHRDEVFVRRLNNSLRSVGIVTWFDRERLKPGMNWRDEIRKGVVNCACFLFVLSPPAVGSTFVGRERTYAEEYQKSVLTVLRHPCEIPDEYREIQYADFCEDANFKYAFLGLGEAICQFLPNGEQICTALRQKPQYVVTEYLQQIKEVEETIQDWLMNLAQNIPEKSPWVMTALDETSAARLAEYASDYSLRNPQRREDAARLIADLGALNALKFLAEDTTNRYALDALAVIYEKRQDLPLDVVAGLRGRIFRRAAMRQITRADPPVLPRFVAAAAGPALGIALTIYIETGLLERFPLSALGGALSNGIAYGLMVGIAVLWASELAPRLKILKQFRLPLALLGGWLLATTAFFLLIKLFYGRTPESWNSVMLLSLLFMAGFTASSLFRTDRLSGILGRMVVAFIGVFAALNLPYLTIEGLFLDPRLLFFSTDWEQKSLVVSAVIGVIPFIPDLIDYLLERKDSLAGQFIARVVRFFRIRLRKEPL